MSHMHADMWPFQLHALHRTLDTCSCPTAGSSITYIKPCNCRLSELLAAMRQGCTRLQCCYMTIKLSAYLWYPAKPRAPPGAALSQQRLSFLQLICMALHAPHAMGSLTLPERMLGPDPTQLTHCVPSPCARESGCASSQGRTGRARVGGANAARWRSHLLVGHAQRQDHKYVEDGHQAEPCSAHRRQVDYLQALVHLHVIHSAQQGPRLHINHACSQEAKARHCQVGRLAIWLVARLRRGPCREINTAVPCCTITADV